jgi:ornithine cyclodeaminase
VIAEGGLIWLTEADVVRLMSLGDAIPLEAEGAAANMTKTHLPYHGHDTLHALGGAVVGLGLVGTKSWCHTEGGAAPTLLLWDAHDGSLRAVIEAFALGQMRTGGISGLATKWLAPAGADELAVCGTGRQAVTQVAAVHAAIGLKRLRVWSPTKERREAFAGRMRADFGIQVVVAPTARDCLKDAPVVTSVTLARQPFIEASMLAKGAHFNAVGAIVPERSEFAADVFSRCDLIAVDSVEGVRKLSREFIDHFGSGNSSWDSVKPLSAIIAAGKGRPPGADLTLFKAMGMGLSDLAMGAELIARAKAAGIGLPLPQRVRAQPRIGAARDFDGGKR